MAALLLLKPKLCKCANLHCFTIRYFSENRFSENEQISERIKVESKVFFKINKRWRKTLKKKKKVFKSVSIFFRRKSFVGRLFFDENMQSRGNAEDDKEEFFQQKIYFYVFARTSYKNGFRPK
jgi:hypothetical protein